MRKVAIVMVLLSFAGISLADVPRLINYPGKLTDASGHPLTGSYSMVFTLYDSESAGNAVWQETQPAVQVNKGVFNVLLGSITLIPSAVAFNQPLWLSVNVGAEGEMTPRQKISSVAYALNSDSVDGLHAGNVIQPNTLLALDSSSRFPLSVVRVPMIYSGCADIDSNTPEKCFIQMSAVPSSVVLYMFGEKFSTWHYTEIGQHKHAHSATHLHGLGTSGGGNSVQLSANAINSWWATYMTAVSPGDTDYTGVNGGALSTSLKSYLDAMEVWIDDDNRTSTLLGKLSGWSGFGDGTAGHALCGAGTGAIDITDVTNWTVGQHIIEFKHPQTGGGRLRYYIYVRY